MKYDFSDLTTKELKQKLDLAKVSDAPKEIKEEYIKAIEYYLNLPLASDEAVRQYEEGKADVDDILRGGF